MTTLEQLVPPFELCQQIPKDAFNDTALVWCFNGLHYWVIPRRDYVRWPTWISTPAPTAQELLDAMHSSCPAVKRGYFSRYSCTVVANANGTEFLRAGENLPEVLLKLWLDVRREN